MTDNSMKIIPTLSKVRESVERATADYIRSTNLVNYQVNGFWVSLDIRDILMIGAMTESDVLITGKTGSGKTKLANSMMKGLFGSSGYYSKTTLPTMNPSEFMDIDFPSIVEGKKSLRDSIAGIQSLTKPGIVLNEVWIFPIRKIEGNVLKECGLIVFDDEMIMGVALFNQIFCKSCLGQQCIRRNDFAFNVNWIQ